MIQNITKIKEYATKKKLDKNEFILNNFPDIYNSKYCKLVFHDRK